MSNFIEDTWFLTSASEFNLLQYIVLLEIHKQNPGLHTHVVVKGRSILIVFPDNCGYSSLLLHQHSTSGSFLKDSCDVEPYTLLS